MIISIFNKQISSDDIIDYSESYKNESFMRLRTDYIEHICKNIGIYVDGHFNEWVDYAINEYKQVPWEILYQIGLYVFEQSKLCGALTATGMQQILHNLNEHAFGKKACKVLKFGHLDNNQFKFNDVSHDNYGAHHFRILTHDGREHTIHVFLRDIMFAFCKLIYYLSVSWKQYEAGWHKKMLNHLSKNQLSENNSESMIHLRAEVASIKAQSNKQVDALRFEVSALKELIEKQEATITWLQASMTHAIEEIKDECKQATSQPETNEYVKRYEITPIYDYPLIKARRRLMHQEYSSVYKFFSRLIRIRYDTPIAVAIPQK